MLKKRLKKLGKECLKADDPVLLALSGYLNHVINYLECSKDADCRATEYGSALAGLDFSDVDQKYRALAATDSGAEKVSVSPSPESDEKRGMKKGKKEVKEATEVRQVPVIPGDHQEADGPAADALEPAEGERRKKRKKKKKKGK